MRTIVWSEETIDEYAAAFEYLADRSPDAADRLRQRVRETLDLLARRLIGRPDYASETFEKIIQRTSWIIVFELAGDELRIMRLFHMAQDWRGWREETPEPQ